MEGEREFEQLYLFACARGLLADVRPACVCRVIFQFQPALYTGSCSWLFMCDSTSHLEGIERATVCR